MLGITYLSDIIKLVHLPYMAVALITWRTVQISLATD